MKESKTWGERQCIFRSCFNDEATVRAQGGVPVGSTFVNGTGFIAGNGSYITFNRRLPNGVYSIRAKVLKTSLVSRGYVFDYRNIGIDGVGHCYISDTSGSLSVSSGTKYVNNVLNGSVVAGVWSEIVVTGITITNGTGNTPIVIGSYANLLSYPLGGYIELFEIYNYTLTSDEVSNLYNNSRYRDVGLNKDEQLGPELVVDGGFDTPASWTCSAGWSVSGSKANYDDVTNSTAIITAGGISFTVGKRYKITYTISGLTAGTADFRIQNQAQVYFLDVFGTTLNKANGTYTEIALCLVAATNIRFNAYTSSGSAWSLDNLSIKEVLVERTRKILDVDACCGIRNKLSGDVYGSELVPLWNTYAWWTTVQAGWSFVEGVSATCSSGSPVLYKAAGWTNGKRYRIIMTISVTSGGITLPWDGVTGAASYRTTSGTHTVDYIAGDGKLYIHTNLFVGTITALSIKEIIPSVVNTATTVQKINDVNAMSFNGTTSKIDCGSYDGLVGDKTIVAWMNPIIKVSGSNLYFSNNKFVFGSTTGSKTLLVYSDGATAASSSAIINYRNWQLIIITRTFTGITNIYINGILSGTANQSSGTPAVGTANIHIGFNQSTGLYSKGLMDKVRVVDGILTPAEISQIYSNERSKYLV